jgi:hypothetical protein
LQYTIDSFQFDESEGDLMTPTNSSQCRISPSDDDEVRLDSETGEAVKDLEEVDYSTDNSSEIEDWDDRIYMRSYKRIMYLFDLAKNEGRDSKTEFFVHQIKVEARPHGSDSCKLPSTTRTLTIVYVCHLLIIWPNQEKAWAQLGSRLANSEVQARRNLCHDLGGEGDACHLMAVV